MQRYFIPIDNWQADEVQITGDDAHHIQRVMRLDLTDQIICNHPNGNGALCEIIELTPTSVIAKIIEWMATNNELPVDVTIAQGLPKGNKLDLILQKGTELGASGFHLFQAERSIVKWDKKKIKQRFNRYEKILKEASEQSYRNVIPSLIHSDNLTKLLQDAANQYDVILFAYEEEAKTTTFNSLANALTNTEHSDKVLICIGPEGGFTKTEVDLFKVYNATAVRLGKRILRTETASLYALASVSYHFEEIQNVK